MSGIAIAALGFAAMFGLVRLRMPIALAMLAVGAQAMPICLDPRALLLS